MKMRHPEMDIYGVEDEINRAISDPQVVTDGREPGRKHAYYAPAPFGFRSSDLIKVLASLSGTGRGYLNSAYIVTAIGQNESVLWAK